MKKNFLLLLLSCFLFVGYGLSCGGGRITAWDSLKGDKDAYIIKYKGSIFNNVTELVSAITLWQIGINC